MSCFKDLSNAELYGTDKVLQILAGSAHKEIKHRVLTETLDLLSSTLLGYRLSADALWRHSRILNALTKDVDDLEKILQELVGEKKLGVMISERLGITQYINPVFAA